MRNGWYTLYKDDLVTVRARPHQGHVARVIDQRGKAPVYHNFASCSVRQDRQTGDWYIGGPRAPVRDEWRNHVTVDDAGPDSVGGEE